MATRSVGNQLTCDMFVADGLSLSKAPNVSAGTEDQGSASRSVYTRTVDEGEREKALEARQSALRKDGECPSGRS